MKKILICLILVLLFAFVANAQTKSMTGTVVDTEMGMYKWGAIIVQVGNKRYFVYTFCGLQATYCNPKIVGKVDEVGRKVKVYYSRIVRSSEGYDGEVRAIRIVEVKKSSPRKNKRKI